MLRGPDGDSREGVAKTIREGQRDREQRWENGSQPLFERNRRSMSSWETKTEEYVLLGNESTRIFQIIHRNTCPIEKRDIFSPFL